MEHTAKILLKDDQWLKDLFDHAHDLIQIVHVDGTILYVNNAWAKLLECSREEVCEVSLYSFIAEQDQQAYQTYRKNVINGIGANKPIVFNLKSKTGRLIPVEGIVSVAHENGKPAYTRGIFRDISLRLQNEARLRQLNKELEEREQNLTQLLVHAPDAVIVISKESNVSFWNPKAETLFGWREEEVRGQPLQNFIIPLQYRAAHERGMKHYLATGEGPVLNSTIEITALKKSGEEFYISLTISPTSQNGQRAFIAFIRDITAQKRNQLELEKKTKELEQFTHVSHHDLQEPLRKIILFSDMIRSDSYERLTEASQKRFDRILDAARRMGNALRDILNYASLGQEEQWSETDLTEVLRAVEVDLELVIAEKNASIVSDPLPTLNAIPGQMHQLFYNLLNNALKFSKPGIPPVISIRCRIASTAEIKAHAELDQHRRYYSIVVRDNGIGFDQSAAEKIFAMFQRLHSKEAYAGTGIGLALVKKVVQNHNGKIVAESTPGNGALFNILLPADG
ncbi:MAG: PAS domain S-box protein [Bacteroidota bacterium]|nr:PAS domain S-box protein [Bacteroidota bacterium]